MASPHVSPFSVGERVRISPRYAFPMNGGSLIDGYTGTLVRPARLLWKRAWLIELDNVNWMMLRRTRVAETALQHLDLASRLSQNCR